MPQTYPFLPFGAAASTIGLGDSAVSTITLNVNTVGLGTSCRVTNAGSVSVWIQFVAAGDTTTVSVSQGILVLSTQSHVFRTGGKNKVQLITSAGTASVFVTVGEGMPTT